MVGNGTRRIYCTYRNTIIPCLNHNLQNKDTILFSITPPHRPIVYRRSAEKYDSDLDREHQTQIPCSLSETVELTRLRMSPK